MELELAMPQLCVACWHVGVAKRDLRLIKKIYKCEFVAGVAGMQ